MRDLQTKIIKFAMTRDSPGVKNTVDAIHPMFTEQTKTDKGWFGHNHEGVLFEKVPILFRSIENLRKVVARRAINTSGGSSEQDLMYHLPRSNSAEVQSS